MLLTVWATLAPSTACHNTWRGVKTDTKRALDKTGHELEKAGDKVEGHPDHERKDGH